MSRSQSEMIEDTRIEAARKEARIKRFLDNRVALGPWLKAAAAAHLSIDCDPGVTEGNYNELEISIKNKILTEGGGYVMLFLSNPPPAPALDHKARLEKEARVKRFLDNRVALGPWLKIAAALHISIDCDPGVTEGYYNEFEQAIKDKILRESGGLAREVGGQLMLTEPYDPNYNRDSDRGDHDGGHHRNAR